METAQQVLILVLIAVSAVAVFYLILVLRNAAKLLLKAQSSVDELNKSVAELRPRVLPIIENAEETLARVNNDLEQVEYVLTDVSSVTQNIADLSDKVSNIVATPVKVGNDIVERFLNLRKARNRAKLEVAALEPSVKAPPVVNEID